MDLREASLGFYRTWHAALGARHGLFAALRTDRLAPQELAAARRLAVEPVGRWCEGAFALGLLEKDARGRYRLRREHEATLGDPASVAYLGHHFDYLARKSEGFGALDGVLRGARPNLDLARVYALATSYDHVAFFDGFLPRRAPLLRAFQGGIDVLDLGAGEGGWTREARQRFPASRFVAADLRARRVGGLAIRDARTLARASFDVVYMGEVLAAAKDPAKALATAHRALRPGGTLVALEGLLPDPARAPRGWGERLVLAMGLDFSMDGSRFLTKPEALRLLVDAGLTRPTARDLGGSLFALSARKPQT